LQEEDYDLTVPMEAGLKKLIDSEGAGKSSISPGWLTQLGRLWGGKSVSVRYSNILLLWTEGLTKKCLSTGHSTVVQPRNELRCCVATSPLHSSLALLLPTC
jgi:hypothetical protein